MAEKNRIRVELVLTDSDADIIDIMEASGLPRATFFKKIVRDYMKMRDNAGMNIEHVVKQAVREVISQHDIKVVPEVIKPPETVVKSANKKKFGFPAKTFNNLNND